MIQLNNLKIIQSEQFGDLECDIFQNDEADFFMTANQLCDCLGETRSTFDVRISRNEYLKNEQFSVSYKMQGTDGKQYNTRLFNEDGIYEITMLSNSDKAREFRAWIRQILKALRKKEYKLVSISEYQHLVAASRLLNAQIRKARELMRLADLYRGTEYAQILDSYATEALAGAHILPLPTVKGRTYSAKEVGHELGISANKVGIIANRHNLKTDDYGVWVHDKSPHSNKQVQNFHYYTEAIPVIRKLINGNVDDSQLTLDSQKQDSI